MAIPARYEERICGGCGSHLLDSVSAGEGEPKLLRSGPRSRHRRQQDRLSGTLARSGSGHGAFWIRPSLSPHFGHLFALRHDARLLPTRMRNRLTTAAGAAIGLAIARLNKGRVVTGLFIVLAVSFISTHAFAQRDSHPKRDFLGYQWRHPGGTVPAATCSVQPKEVVVGEPVAATLTTSNFNPKHTLTYVWYPSDGGGKVIGNDATAQIETTNAAPSSYT